ncbi:hypothetical protein [Vibrio diabolicus]|uniref:hypothetical protein n=1 Tax=Vibrio diabolicus TaxID=50719 RepID=UPI00249596C5|nr:hypothetical protein [Vibrio diabolicus]
MYIAKTIAILKGKFKVSKLPLLSELKSFNKFWELHSQKKDVALLNWYEDNASFSLLRAISYLFYFIYIRAAFKKVIWIRHNIAPHHNRHGILYKAFVYILSSYCDRKITHKPMKGFDFIPHINYIEQVTRVSSPVRDVEFLIFGQIKKYKGIDELLKTWPTNLKLVIIGKCTEPQLELDINDIIVNRGLDVEFTNKFIDQKELNKLLLKTKQVIIPNEDNSMIVSGVFYHAASFGANILLKEGGLYDFLSNEYSFVKKLNSIGIDSYQVVNDKQVIDEIENKNSNRIVLQYYEKFIRD